MKNRVFLRCFAAFLLFLSSHSFATSWKSDIVYFVRAHYSAVAFGKPVQSVMVHTGVLEQDGPGWMGAREIFYWTDSKDIFLQQKGDHFAGQYLLEASSSKFGPFVKYPVVQYWITFTDGTRTISDVYPIEVDRELTISQADEFARLRRDWEEAFSRLTDSTETTADALTFMRIQ